MAAMSRPLVPDTTVLIDLIRQPRGLPEFQRDVAAGRLYMPSVVIAELYAGSRSPAESVILDRIVRAINRIDRMLTPSAEEWATAGRLIARRIRLHGALRPRDHLADVLIVVTAARLTGEVVSANRVHMTDWITLARGTGLDVTLADRSRFE